MTPRARRLAALRAVATLAVLALAIAALPTELFPFGWLTAFAAPALVFHLLVSRTRLRPVDALGVAVLAQAAALFVAYRLIGPLDRLAGLGCTLVPPLVHLTVRAGPLDAMRSLFLAFCLFLIGSILGTADALLVVAFVTAGVVALATDTALETAAARASWRGPAPRLAAVLRGALPVVGGGLLTCLAVFQVLRALPSPSDPPVRPPAATAPDPRPRVGVSDSFDLDQVGEGLLDLTTDRLVRVRVDRPPARGDLYLRCGHFDVAGLDRWSWRRPRALRPARDPWPVGRNTRALPLHVLEVELLEPRAGFAFVPPGAVTVSVPPGLVGSPRDAWFRFEDPPPAGTRLQVAWQDLRGLSHEELTTGGDAGLLALPPDLERWRGLFDEILQRADVRGQVEPLAIATGIADVLAERCDYALEKPSGPHPHALLNFLDGDRRGFCMHFASATALCLRLAGVPCRIGVGVYGGQPDPQVAGARLFGSRDAHAWVEVPIDGFGWLVFDPTPAAARADRLWPAPDAPAGVGGAADDGSVSADLAPASAADLLRDPLRFGWLWAVVILGTGLAFGWRRPARDPRTSAERTPPAARSARRDVEILLRHLRRAGRPRLAGESLERFAGRLDADGIDAAIPTALTAYQAIRFGGRSYDAARRATLAAGIAAARRIAPRRESAPAAD